MDAKTIITQHFDNKLKTVFKDKETVLKYLLNHERKQTCIENILSEIRKEELGLNRFTADHLKLLGEQYAVTFAKASIEYLEQQQLTQLQKDIKLKEAQEAQEIKDMFDSSDKSEAI